MDDQSRRAWSLPWRQGARASTPELGALVSGAFASACLAWLTARWSVLVAGSGLSIACVALLRHRRRLAAEVRARKASELARRRYQQIVETSREMLLFVDRELRFQLVNQAYADFLGVRPEALRGRSVRAMVGEPIWTRIAPELAATLAGEPRRFAFESDCPDGQRRFYEVDHSPFRVEGEVMGVVVSLHDVTTARTAQAALEAERARLEERVAARTAELRHSEATLRTIFDLLPMGISITGPDGRIRDCNQAAAAILGVDPCQFEQTDVRPRWPALRPDGSPMPRAEYASVRALGERRPVRDLEMGLVMPGGVRWLLVSAMPLPSAAEGVVVVYVDITERKEAAARLEASEARARAVIDASPVPIAIARADGAVDYLNPAFVATFGYRREEMPAWPDWLRQVVTDPGERERLDLLCRARPDGVAAGIRCQNGTVRVVTARATPLGGSTDWLNTLYDITDIKRAQEQAEQAARGQARFLAHMSHEIRTPMNGILGLTEVALHRAMPSAVREDLSQVHQSATSLLGILDDILDFSRIEAGRLSLEQAPFDLDALLTTLRGIFVPAASLKGLALEMELGPEVPRYLLGDPLRLQQVLSNLLSNAIKFTDAGHVRLDISALTPETPDGALRWQVIDSGIGMDAAALARLFTPFVQGDDSIARRFGGTGLGLSIAHELLRLMGSELVVESTPGRGSCFRFDLALERATPLPARVTPATAVASELGGVRLLVAEDQPVNQRVIGDMLRLLGIPFTLVSNGRDALASLAESPCSAVLMDVQMPGMDGLTATRLIRRDPRWSDLPIIALTAGVTPDERERIADAGMDDLLVKPVTLAALRGVLARWLGTTIQPPAAPAPAPAPADAEQEGGFDLRRLSEFEDAAGVNALLHHFADTTRDDVTALTAVLAADDTASALQITHRLAGVAGTVGATAVQRAAAGLTARLRAGDDPDAALARLRTAHAEALAAIARRPSSSPLDLLGRQPDPRAAHQILGALQAEVGSGLIVSTRQLESLAAVLSAHQHALYRDLLHHLDRFDYHAAGRSLDALRSATPATETPDHDG